MNQTTKEFFRFIINNKFSSYFLEHFNEVKEFKYRQILNEKIQNRQYQEGNVCIVLDKGMGDFILFAYYFEKIIEYYRKKDKKVYVICNNYNIKFLEFYHGVLPQIIVIPANENNNYIYEELTKECFEILILPLDTISKFYCNIIRQLAPKKIYSVGNKICNFRDFCEVSLSDRKMLSSIKVFNGTNKGFYAERHKILTDNLTNNSYDLMLTNLESGERVIEYEYYIINIGASSKTKVWPIEKVSVLIKMLEGKINAKPIIMGNANTSEIEYLESRGINCSFTNLMDIRKTISLCSHAKFVITNDTGLYHLSVCLGKRTYVISAGSYMEHFIPYPEKLVKQEVTYIVPDSKCENCKNHLTCFLNRRKGKTLECLEEISPQIVLEHLKNEYSYDSHITNEKNNS